MEKLVPYEFPIRRGPHPPYGPMEIENEDSTTINPPAGLKESIEVFFLSYQEVLLTTTIPTTRSGAKKGTRKGKVTMSQQASSQTAGPQAPAAPSPAPVAQGTGNGTTPGNVIQGGSAPPALNAPGPQSLQAPPQTSASVHPPTPVPSTAGQAPILAPASSAPYQGPTFIPAGSSQLVQMTHPVLPVHIQGAGFNPMYQGFYNTPMATAAGPSQVAYPGAGWPSQPQNNPGAQAPPAPAFTFNAGPASNKVQWGVAFGRDLKYDAFRLKNLNHGVFQGAWDDADLLLYVAFYGRVRAQVVGTNMMYAVTIFAIGEGIMDCLPDSAYLDQAQAQAAFIQDISSLFPLSSVGWLRVDATTYANALTNELRGLNLPATHSEGLAQALDLRGAYAVMVWLAKRLTASVRKTEIILWTLVALVKQGNISDRFTNKITQSLEQEVGVTVTLPSDGIRAVWDVYGPYINEVTAGPVFNRWLPLVPQNALRVRLTILQAAGEGLTAFTTILKALRAHPRFHWSRVINLFPQEWDNFVNAVTAVGANTFYGFKKDLGVVRSTMYKNLGYVAKELMVKVSGDAPLNFYAGWTRIPAFRTIIDQMVVDYEAQRAADLTGGGHAAYLPTADAALSTPAIMSSTFPLN
ncbi:putative nucleoprotein [Wenzhou crab virus 2]|uniref:Putative nucleoprotein n=1 Tax=Wenzhou crab virus 2 TaxID=1608092 RepID=A0A0B5KT97_9VIRU|nr:putative nucleoprotein [Wenzhou crab virus 2]AJG39062.1 putative nucleoprotein [Wenzhou crab virus 2]